MRTGAEARDVDRLGPHAGCGQLIAVRTPEVEAGWGPWLWLMKPPVDRGPVVTSSTKLIAQRLTDFIVLASNAGTNGHHKLIRSDTTNLAHRGHSAHHN